MGITVNEPLKTSCIKKCWKMRKVSSKTICHFCALGKLHFSQEIFLEQEIVFIRVERFFYLKNAI